MPSGVDDFQRAVLLGIVVVEMNLPIAGVNFTALLIRFKRSAGVAPDLLANGFSVAELRKVSDAFDQFSADKSRAHFATGYEAFKKFKIKLYFPSIDAR